MATLSTAEIAEKLGVSQLSVHRWSEAKVIPVVCWLPNGAKRFNEADVIKALNERHEKKGQTKYCDSVPMR